MWITGTITKSLPDGTEASADYIIDTDEQTVVQVGGEAHITAEDIDIIQFMMFTGPQDLEEGEADAQMG